MWGPSFLARLPWLGWVLIVHSSVTFIVNWMVPEPYMDEVFHISQAQAYCRGDFQSWNPKLTTPPALYIFSNLLLRPFSLLPDNESTSENSDSNSTAPLPVPWWCTVQSLRWTNTVLSTCVYLALVSLFLTLHPGRTGAQAALSAFALAWFPVLFGTGMLYYTDVGSTVAVMTSYLYGLRRRYWSSAMVSLVAIAFRQTNVIWAAFTAAVCLSRQFAQDESTRGDYYNPLAAELSGTCSALKPLKSFLKMLFSRISLSFAVLAPYLLVFIAFSGFVVWNGGSIVLGDQKNHEMSLHFPQIFYMLGFTAAFASPALLRSDHFGLFFKFLASRFRNPSRIISSIALLAGMIFAIHHFTIQHPFILSDNRHYSFYVWKDIYRRHWLMPYALIPAYIFAGWLCWGALAIQQSVVWIIAYITAMVLTLVPTPLLEFRYFIIPYIMYRLHIRQPSRLRLLAEAIVYTIVNCIALYAFLARPFQWSSEPGRQQRFMW